MNSDKGGPRAAELLDEVRSRMTERGRGYVDEIMAVSLFDVEAGFEALDEIERRAIADGCAFDDASGPDACGHLGEAVGIARVIDQLGFTAVRFFKENELRSVERNRAHRAAS